MSSSGNEVVIALVYSATPIGEVIPRNAYSATTPVLRLAEEQTDRRLVFRMCEQTVDGRHVHAHLAEKRRFDFTAFSSRTT